MSTRIQSALQIKSRDRHSLPPGWKWVTVQELSTKVVDGTHHTPTYTTTGVPFISVKDIRDGQISFADCRYISSIDNAELSKRCRPEKGDVLITKSGTIGRVAVVNTNEAFSLFVSVALIKPLKGELNAQFLKLALEHYISSIDIQQDVKGGVIKNLHLEDIRVIPLKIAPSHEQHRIVAEIEKQFTRLDAGVASLKRVQAALKRYRASVLKAACEGRLTITKAPVTLRPLQDLITGLGQGWSPKCELNRDPLPGEWAVIKTTAIQSMKYLDSECKPLPKALSPRPGIEVKVGDFLMTRKGPRQRAGVTCLVRATRERLMVCDTVYRFRCHECSVNPAYLELALNSPQILSEIDTRKSGINDSGVSLTHEKLGGVLLPIPALAEQERIVAEVERRISVIEELETAVKANLKRAERLRQSILQRAFSGDLQTRSPRKHRPCIGT